MRRTINKVLTAAVVMAALMAVTAPSALADVVPIPEEAAPGLVTAVENGAPIVLGQDCSPFLCSSYLVTPGRAV
jgi:hypothetical protein